ncbi:Kae1-associated serine/threonine protein kinase [Candidatus Pacearchaeota archaeon]|nr:Kae1-associated serine/threonine protein kinase [Candidatus Pacearchaeota archaeon]
MKQLISQGAEAKIFLSNEVITKDRIPKTYRHPQLDNLIRTRRTKSESKLLTKALSIKANVPKVLNTSPFKIQLEYINGDRLSETLNSYPEKKQFQVMQQIGEQTALLHQNNIIHGDLTTSNTILSKNKLFLIDFGLGFISTKLEDKSVDLHLIKQALEAKHFQNPKELFENFTKGYQWSDSEKIIERLKIVEKRGRYKH